MNRETLTFFLLLLLFFVSPVHGQGRLLVRGESLTPAGKRVSLLWRVEQGKDSYRFYLGKRFKAEMRLKAGTVIEIRRHVRVYGTEKWIVIRNPRQISLELKSGFYPFSALLNYRKNKTLETVLATGSFSVIRESVK